MECFQNFLGRIILDTKSFEDIRGEYLKYCEEYVEKIGNISEDEQEKMLMIKRSYHYMSDMLIKRKNTYLNKSKITKKVLDAYEDLMSQIASYFFRNHDYYTWGAMQNLTIKKILTKLLY